MIEGRINLEGISLGKKLGKSSSREKSGHAWKPRDVCKKLGREIGPLPESGVGWESSPLPRNSGSRDDISGASSWPSVSLPTLLLSPTQMKEHTHTHTHNLSLSLTLSSFCSRQFFFFPQSSLAAVIVNALRLLPPTPYPDPLPPTSPSHNYCSFSLAGESLTPHPKALGHLGDSTSGATPNWNLRGLEGARGWGGWREWEGHLTGAETD